MGIRKEYEDALKALREAQAYASRLEPRPGDRTDDDSLKRWMTATQLVGMLQAAVDRLAHKLADTDDTG